MTVVIVVAVAFLGVVAASAVAAVAFLRRRNRINPRVRSSAPLSWLWSVHGPARAHRRLRRAMSATRAAVAQGRAAGFPVDGLLDCVEELERVALTVDGQLVVASRFAGVVRRQMLAGVRPQVDEIEVLAGRVAATVVSRASLSEERVADVVARVHQRLDALDAAHAEIARLEHAWQRPGWDAALPPAQPSAWPPPNAWERRAASQRRRP